ncbi:hypothetical protein IEQ34_015581 [Dendrobium chrysotoxum]|uniref:Epidermal patterning factor-like protein n=1 Tax=Dendrobium chrysotoxum TaxID=161865 RepID=A0AAV7G135_DENCH|nr:hypothetical protein IEQ34_015581 [Dendrobium chrysotoxum]
MSPPIMSHGVPQTTALLRFLLLLPIFVSFISQWPLQSSPPPPQEAMKQEKLRLGSMPPSCHSRCNNCNPCTAVEAPTLPGPTGRVGPADQPAYSQYNSNYKPLGWKCGCGGRFYNP